MSPGRSRERIHTLFGRLVEAYADECDIALDGYGSWTLKDEAVARGVEADECYILGDPEADRPDLAIEVIWTSGGLDKLDLCGTSRSSQALATSIAVTPSSSASASATL